MIDTIDPQQNNGNALTIYTHEPAVPTRSLLSPRSPEEAFSLAKTFFESGMFGVKSPAQALVVLMTGDELGFSPAQSLRGINVINGRPSLSSEMMVALCKRRRDVCQYFQLIQSDDKGATYETQRVGEPQPVRMSFSMEDAKRAQLWGKAGPWSAFPAAMMRARCVSALVKAVYSDLILGLYEEDEARHIPPIASRFETHSTETAPVLGVPESSERARETPEQKIARRNQIISKEAERVFGTDETATERFTNWLGATHSLENLNEATGAQAKTVLSALKELEPAAIDTPEADPFADAPEPGGAGAS